jgi:hypothetical protein
MEPFHNGYGASAELYSVKLLNEGFGTSVDDTDLEPLSG